MRWNCSVVAFTFGLAGVFFTYLLPGYIAQRRS